MPKLVLRFDERVLKECALVGPVSIGRLPDNTVVIDNPAVSARHARVVEDQGRFLVEDLDSRNGTFVNGVRVVRQVLADGDVVQVGKHTLRFDAAVDDAPVAAPRSVPSIPDFGGTVMLDPDQQRRLLAAVAKLREEKARASQPAPVLVGVLRVLRGRSDRMEYSLDDGGEAVIGKAAGALVRLRGWFKPKLAAAIGRLGEGYVVTPLGGTTLINGQRLVARRGLMSGDLIQIGGLILEFRLIAEDRRHAA